MIEYQKKRKVRKILYSWPSLLLLAVVAGILVKAAWNVYDKEAASAAYLGEAQGELLKVSDNQQSLSQAVSSLQTEQGMEAEIRRKFAVVKNGEGLAVIVDDEGASSSMASASPAASSATSGSLWQRFVDFFMN